MSRRDEFDWLRRRIQSWNETRVELFKISLPDENGVFSGVMKFFYQYEEKDGQKVATKCIKVTSNDTVPDVIEVLVQKFRPDLKMLPNLSSYSLYEIHNESREGDVRRMDLSERPLIEMIKWSQGGREGRFLLRNELSFSLFQQHKKANGSPAKRAKKSTKNTKEKRKSKRSRDRSGSSTKFDEPMGEGILDEAGSFADILYDNYPSSKFTRSITNPEIVRNAWSSKADKRLRGSYQAVDDIGSDESSVVVLGGSVMPTKNIVAGDTDTAGMIVQSAVDRFQLGVSPSEICVVESMLPPVGGQANGVTRHSDTVFERVLADDECLVKVYTRWRLGEPGIVNRDILQFQLRRRASISEQLTAQQPVTVRGGGESRYNDLTLRPYLVRLSPDPSNQKVYYIKSFPVEIGSKLFHLNPDSHVCLASPEIAPQHCTISQTYKGAYTIEPLNNTALVIVNDNLVNNVRPLPIGAIIKLSEQDILQFIVPTPPSTVHDKVKERLGQNSVDNLTPTAIDKEHPPLFPTHNRTVSEHTLKSDIGVLQCDSEEGGASSEGGMSNREDLDKERVDVPEDVTMATDMASNGVHVTTTNIKTARNDKKRHNSAPHTSDFQFLEETPESELAVLPASISFTHQNEASLLQALISDVNGSTLEFKLAPAYALYMIARHHLSSEYHPEHSRHHSLIHMIKQTCSCIKRTVKDNKYSAGTLALWLSNTSELLHFLRRDYRLCMYAHEYENTLTSIIHMAYKLFTEYMCSELGLFLSAFLSDSVEADKDIPFPFINGRNIDQISEPDVVPPGSLTHHANLANQYWTPTNPKAAAHSTKPTIGYVMSTLKASFSLLHQCRVNTTLSLMVFNLLFRYMSTKLLNKLVTDHKCCGHSVAIKMMRRLKKVESWAIHKGLHLPVDDHLSIIIQAVTLLQVPKRTADDINALHSTCNKLNSKQITELLNNFELAEGEGSVSVQLKEQLIALAVQSVDQALISNGIPVKAQEKSNLQLPFLIPEQGYSCDSMRGLPVGLEEYLEHAIKLDLCHLHITKDTLGCWVPPRMTTSNQRESPLSTQASTQMSQTLPKNFSQTQNHFASMDPTTRRRLSEANLASSSSNGVSEQLQLVSVKLKKVNRTLGINICEKKVNVGHGQLQLLIFIKSLSEDGPAKKSGRIEIGDQILKVDSTVLTGITKQMVIKLLSNSESEVTLLIAKRAAEHYGLLILPDNSPYTDRKGYSNHESSHSIKAQRRQLREQQNDMAFPPRPHMPHYHQQHTLDYHLPPSSVPNSAIGGYNPHTHTARWIQEQRDHSLHKPARSTQSLNLLLENEESYATRQGGGRVLYTDSSVASTPPGSDISDLPPNQHYAQHSYSRKSSADSKYGRLSTVSNTSKLHDPLSSTRSNYSDYSYSSMGARLGTGPRRLSVDSEYSNGVDMPTSLSVQTSEPSDPNGSQAYPSLMMEKLSMEVGCHTQNNSSSAGLTMTNILEQLAQKSRQDKEKGGLKKNEIKGLDVDEIDLEKQRMKFLFYEQTKERSLVDQEAGIKALDKQIPMDSNAKVSEWVNKEQDMIVEDDELLLKVDPEKLLQITHLQSKLDSLKKMVNDQRKKNRETQFAKERVKQSLHEEERKAQQAQGRNVKAFMKSEDQIKWQKDQKKRLKEWEKIRRDKASELQHYECKEREGKSRLKALEQHLGEIKKQLSACKGSVASRLLSATDEFGSSKLGEDIPERDWSSRNKPQRFMSTDSITTESSIISSENPESMLKDSMSLGSDLSIPSFSEYGNMPARNSPFSNRSDSSSPIGQMPSNRSRYLYNPELHGSMEMRPYHNHYSKLPLTRGCSADQDRRLRMLKEEHHMHISSMDNIPSYTREDRLHQLNQIRQEAKQNTGIDSSALDKNSYQHQWSKSSTNVFQYRGGSIDNSNVESSLSNTPDVVPPEFLLNKPLHQSSSAMSIPYQNDPALPTSTSYKYSYSRSHSRPSSGCGYTDTTNMQPSYRGNRLGTSSSATSSEYLSGMGRTASKEVLFEKPEKLVSKSSSHGVYSSYTNLRQRGMAADTDTSITTTTSYRQQQPSTSETTSRSSNSSPKKSTKASNSPSTHKYSHRRPDASVNGTDDRSKIRSGHASSHSNLFTISGGQRQQTEL